MISRSRSAPNAVASSIERNHVGEHHGHLFELGVAVPHS